MKYALRDHQIIDTENLRASYRSGNQAVLFQLSTGGGKTVVASFITEGLLRNNKRTFFLVHRRELLKQASRTFFEIGIPHGVIAPGFTPSHDLIQVASVQTLINRLGKIRPPDFIIVDEAHHCIPTTTWGKVLSFYPNAKILGLTATPCRLSGEGLGRHCGGFFDDMVNGPPMSWLIDHGYLVRPRMIYPPDIGGNDTMHKKYGEFVKAEVAAKRDKPVLIGNALDHYQTFSHNLPAIVFCSSVRHAENVAAEAKKRGYRAESVDGTMDERIRDWRIEGIGNGNLHILSSCDLISEGTDIKPVATGILARDTASLTLVMQQIGRILRPVYAPGHDLNTQAGRLAAIAASEKPCANIIDQVSNLVRHDLLGLGYPEYDIEWSLDGEVKRKKKAEESISVRQCEKCYMCYKLPAPCCPQCGHVPEKNAREIEQVEGELQEIAPEQLAEMRRQKQVEQGRAKKLEDLIAVGRARGMKNPAGWARHVINAREKRTEQTAKQMGFL